VATPFTRDDIDTRTVALLLGCEPGQGMVNDLNDLLRDGVITRDTTFGQILDAFLLKILQRTLGQRHTPSPAERDTHLWQDMSSAPKDGTEVLLWCGRPVCGYWSGDMLDPERQQDGWVLDMNWIGMTRPTRWMPIEAPAAV
jgi:hypothetical protein